MAKKSPPKLCVMFDTNILYTQVASELVRQSIKALIEENSTHVDLDIEWHMPRIVIGERKFQMIKKAKELLPSLNKMERLLGHGFGIGEDTLEMHVEKIIQKSIDELNIQVSDVDVTEIDWNSIIERSVFREAPFEDNEKEKGFRDAVIAHSFFQLQKNSPVTPSICRLALVTEDKRLQEYVSDLTVGSKNVRILSSQDELESLINTAVSQIPEELAERLSEKARDMFFDKENDGTLYYKCGVRGQIEEKYANELQNSPIEGLLKKRATWWISNPVFIKKERSRIYWTTAIESEFELYHFEKNESQTLSGGLISDNLSSSRMARRLYQQGLLSGRTDNKKIIDYTGKDIFEVLWSTNLSQSQNLTAPKIEKVSYLGNDLLDENS